MSHPLFDKKHVGEYLLYGSIAAVTYCIPCWLFFSKADYNNAWYLFVGCILFMLTILAYNRKLTKRRSDGYSAMKMLMEGHAATLIGVIFSVAITFLFCVLYVPGFFNTGGSNWLEDASQGINNNKPDLVTIFSITAIGNFAAAAFISIMCSYAMKYNQTKDKPSPL